ncbi:hypothetical protein AK812_SmicGene32428 [Symbiodinium microadriaticum]|uniref:Uncharacterized protein n=1 Tax=Symbiodinium microadriaticum TaxID=2951 RepID=A0A1Q9CU55_SYMMI|nr:hypothetical protein AK812_SmicGene32428 [Symbiodinium microadriaticum]
MGPGLRLLLWLLLFGPFSTPAQPDGALKKEVLVKEAVLDSAIVDIVYLGKNHECLLLTTKQQRLYFSSDSGQSWSEITGKVDSTPSAHLRAERIIVNPADKTVAVLQVQRRVDDRRMLGRAGEKPGAAITDSIAGSRIPRGETFIQISPYVVQFSWGSEKIQQEDRADDAKSKPGKDPEKEDEDPDKDKPCVHRLMLTTDLGKTFIQISPYVVQFSWGSEKIQQEDREWGLGVCLTLNGDIPFILVAKVSSEANLRGSRQIFRGTTNDLALNRRPTFLVQGNSFVIQGKSALSHERPTFVVQGKSFEEKQTVNLMVSSDGASSWKEAARDTGRIFVSDSNGYKCPARGHFQSDTTKLKLYSQSLLHNVRSSQGEVEFDKGLKERPLKGHSGSTLQAMDTADPGYEMARQGMVSYLFSQAKQSASEAAEQAASQGYKESTPTADARSCSWLVIAGKQRVGALFVCQFPFQRSVVSALWNDGCFSASGGERCWGDRLRWFGRAWFQLFFHELPG